MTDVPLLQEPSERAGSKLWTTVGAKYRWDACLCEQNAELSRQVICGGRPGAHCDIRPPRQSVDVHEVRSSTGVKVIHGDRLEDPDWLVILPPHRLPSEAGETLTALSAGGDVSYILVDAGPVNTEPGTALVLSTPWRAP